MGRRCGAGEVLDVDRIDDRLAVSYAYMGNFFEHISVVNSFCTL